MYIYKLFFIGCFLVVQNVDAQVFNSVSKKKPLQKIEVVKPAQKIDVLSIDTVKSIAPIESSKRIFSLPLKQVYVTSFYGNRIDPFSGKIAVHAGIDLRANYDSVFSFMPGLVTKVAQDKKLGKYIVIDHGLYSSVYGHLSLAVVEEDEIIKGGTMIAISGNTGRSTSAHLHFALKKNKRFIDPLPYLNSIYELLSLE